MDVDIPRASTVAGEQEDHAHCTAFPDETRFLRKHGLNATTRTWLGALRNLTRRQDYAVFFCSETRNLVLSVWEADFRVGALFERILIYEIPDAMVDVTDTYWLLTKLKLQDGYGPSPQGAWTKTGQTAIDDAGGNYSGTDLLPTVCWEAQDNEPEPAEVAPDPAPGLAEKWYVPQGRFGGGVRSAWVMLEDLGGGSYKFSSAIDWKQPSDAATYCTFTFRTFTLIRGLSFAEFVTGAHITGPIGRVSPLTDQDYSKFSAGPIEFPKGTELSLYFEKTMTLP